jgi:hypothetical protein
VTNFSAQLWQKLQKVKKDFNNPVKKEANIFSCKNILGVYNNLIGSIVPADAIKMLNSNRKAFFAPRENYKQMSKPGVSMLPSTVDRIARGSHIFFI